VASILIVSHADDDFRSRPRMIHGLLPIWLQQGHNVQLSVGPVGAATRADVVFLHVDASLVDDRYMESVQRFPVVLNRGLRDIRKRAFSDHILAAQDDWAGPVIVKSDLNAGGVPEALLNEHARRMDRAEPYPGVEAMQSYPVYPTIGDVPEVVWECPDRIVQKFVPEHDEHGYWTRFWLFLGSRGRCRRFCTLAPMVKAGASTRREECDVPPEVRAVRARLGIDYGKIDFVMHAGRAIVLDVARTPGLAPARPGEAPSTAEILAPGLSEFLETA
jgi:hypothetical protein